MQQVETLLENKKLLEYQNDELSKQNKFLQDAYDSAKIEIVTDNKKKSRKSKILKVMSFVATMPI